MNLQTDNNNCGGCGLSCSTTCTNGECLVTLASNVTGAGAIVLNAIKAYVAGSANIFSMSLSGGGAINLTTNYPQNSPTGIAIDNQ